jgi:hypothetical protein
MRSIFEDEDDLDTGLLTRVGPRNEPTPQRSITVGTITGFTRIEGAGKTTRKRTKAEALERAQGPVQVFSEIGGAFPLTRPYARGLTALTYGFILLDPLDRLE